MKKENCYGVEETICISKNFEEINPNLIDIIIISLGYKKRLEKKEYRKFVF